MLYVRQDSEAWSMWSATAHCVPYCPDKFSRLPLCTKDSVLLFFSGAVWKSWASVSQLPCHLHHQAAHTVILHILLGIPSSDLPLNPWMYNTNLTLSTRNNVKNWHWTCFIGLISLEPFPGLFKLFVHFTVIVIFFHMAPIPPLANKGWMGLLRFFSFLLCNCLLVW